MKKQISVPLESAEQTALFQWAEYNSRKIPELRMMYHIPNGGSRNKIEAVHLKAQGVKSGVPDICLPIARGKSHGLYIELKRQSGGTISEHQKKWITALNNQGYKAVICKGWQDAAETIKKYLEE